MAGKDDELLDFDDDSEIEDDEDEELDGQALSGASGAGEDDDPDIDAPGQTGGSQLPDLNRGPVPAGPSNADFLAGAAPFMFVHKSAHFADTQVEALGVAHRVVQGAIGLGAIVRLPKMTTTSAATFLASCTQATIKMADPEIFTIGAPVREAKTPSKTSVRNHSWAAAIPAATDPLGQRQQWVSDVLQGQVDAGANVLLSASGWVTDQQGASSLRQAMNWVQLSRAQVADESMFVNLTLPSSWLSDAALRSTLLDEIVESDEQHWYLRIHWPMIEPKQGQLSDPGILDGYRDLVTTARGEGKIVVLLQHDACRKLGASALRRALRGANRTPECRARRGEPSARCSRPRDGSADLHGVA